MRLVILKDQLITTEEMAALENEFVSFYKRYADITPTFYIETKDFTNYPTEIDSDGDVRIKHTYMLSVTDDVAKRYSGEGTDHVVFLVHYKNWQSGKIWGTNYSTKYNGYQVQYVRFDKNIANSMGTLYHEVMHSHDALIMTYLGIDIAKQMNIPNWDRDIVHGSKPDYGKYGYEYIRYKENSSAVTYIAPLLKEAYAKRKAIYGKKVGMMNIIVSLLQKLVILTRAKLTQKNKY